MLRAKLLQEVEQPYSKKCAALQHEAQQAQRSLTSLRREHGELTAATDARVLHLQTQLDNSHSESQAQLAAWKARALAAEATASAFIHPAL